MVRFSRAQDEFGCASEGAPEKSPAPLCRCAVAETGRKEECETGFPSSDGKNNSEERRISPLDDAAEVKVQQFLSFWVLILTVSDVRVYLQSGCCCAVNRCDRTDISINSRERGD